MARVVILFYIVMQYKGYLCKGLSQQNKNLLVGSNENSKTRTGRRSRKGHVYIHSAKARPRPSP